MNNVSMTAQVPSHVRLAPQGQQRKKPRVLNIGCGQTRIPGSIGLDWVMIPGFVDVVHDLNTLPYPFPDQSFDVIHMYHVLEHLDRPLRVMEEIHRILRHGGTLHIRVPHFSSMGAFTDITHKRPFGYSSFDCFQPAHGQHFYTNVGFTIQGKRIKYLGLYPNEGDYARYIHPNACPLLARPFVRFINFLIDRSPTFFERIWCYWVGGATEVVVDLERLP